MNKLPLLTALLLTVSACAVSSKQTGVMQAQERSGGLFGMTKNAAVEVQSPEVFKGKNDIVIGGFKVGFNESKRLQNKASGLLGGSGFGGKSTGLVKLENIDDATRQKITDEIYNSFVADLKAKGYNVKTYNEYAASEQFKSAKTSDFPYVNDSSGMLSSYGVTKYFSPASIGSKQPVYIGEIPATGSFGAGFNFSNPAVAAGEYAAKNKTAVINVAYLVDFAGAGGHAGITSSSLEVGQLLSVDQGHFGLVSGPAGGTFSAASSGNLTLGQPVASEKEFAEVVNTTSDAEAGLETATNVLTAVLGGGTNQTREFVFKADKAKYEEAALDALKKTNNLFLSKLAELK